MLHSWSPKSDIYGQRTIRADKECRRDPGTGGKRELPPGIQTLNISGLGGGVTTSCTCHSQGLWMVNWFCVTSNNHPVTRATIPIQWQKLFQAPEPKLSSQKTTTPPPHTHLFPLLLLWSFLLPLFTTAVTAKCKSLPKNSLLFGNAFLPGSAAVPLTPDSLVPFNLLRQANLSLEDFTPDSSHTPPYIQPGGCAKGPLTPQLAIRDRMQLKVTLSTLEPSLLPFFLSLPRHQVLLQLCPQLPREVFLHTVRA